STSEQGRTMGAGKNSRFQSDLADLVELPAIRTTLGLQDLIPEDPFLQAIKKRARFRLRRIVSTFGSDQLNSLGMQLIHLGIAFDFAVLLGIQRISQILAEGLVNLCRQFLIDLSNFEFTLGFSSQFLEFFDPSNDL